MSVIGPILVDGVPRSPEEATVSVLDIGLQRGYGCFETVRSYGGRAFRLDRHLDRLERSADIMRLTLPARRELEAWVADRAAEGDCSVRIIVTGGIDANRPGIDSHTVVIATALPSIPERLRLQPRSAPWHSNGASSELTGAKSLSYGPNLAARLSALADGYDDALLIGRSGDVLEGPTYSIAWVVGDRLEMPGPELGVLEGVTAGAISEIAPDAGLTLVHGRYPLERLLAADEVIAMSTLRAVRPVIAIGDAAIPVGPCGSVLADLYERLVTEELGEP